MAARLEVLLKRTISPRQPALAPPGEDCAGAKIEEFPRVCGESLIFDTNQQFATHMLRRY